MTSEKVGKIRRELGQFFRHASEGRAHPALLYEVGERMESKLGDENIPSEMADAFEFIHGLHDSGARQYNARSKKELYYHMMRLLE